MTLHGDVVTIVGVRHHSPACARLVAHTIAERRPTHVLIEGPSDMNGRLDELLLDHAMPIAVFSWHRRSSAEPSAVWAPFCEHSPEWVAIRAAREAGAEARFMDLPAWHRAFRAVENRYGDRRGDAERSPSERWIARLLARYRLDDVDTLWDHLFELGPRTLGHADAADLESRLAIHFEALRGDEDVGERDEPREAFMIRCLRWAARDAHRRGGDRARGGVVAVCGGWHRPALLRGLEQAIDASDAPFPEAPPPEPDDDAQGSVAGTWGSYLVPFSHRRLDSLAGYASGMPSPGFYAHVWEEGAEAAADLALVRIAQRLRRRAQPASTADLVACRASAEALARVRAHPVVARGDLLDAVAATLVKDALDVEVPWARRGPLRAGTDPVLVEVVAELAGDAIGRLAAGTPRPPLAADVDAELAAFDLVPGPAPREVELDLTRDDARGRSRTLHRLRVLAVPGFDRRGGPSGPLDAVTWERWSITRLIEADARLVEAASYGASLEAAARGALEERCSAETAGAAELAAALGDAILAALVDFADSVLLRIEEALLREPSFAEVGEALRLMLSLHLHGALLVAAGHPTLARAVTAAFDRGLWLLEGLGGKRAFSAPEVEAVRSLLDAARAARSDPRASVSAERAIAVFSRRAADAAAPPAIRGATLGALTSLGATSDAGARALAAARATPPRDLGDFLAGLFALARQEMIGDPALVQTVDGLLGLATEDDFLAALPSLRFAFAWFPPRERGAIADAVAALHGAPAAAPELLREVVSPGAWTIATRLEAEAREAARRFGLLDALDAEVGEP